MNNRNAKIIASSRKPSQNTFLEKGSHLNKNELEIESNAKQQNLRDFSGTFDPSPMLLTKTVQNK